MPDQYEKHIFGLPIQINMKIESTLDEADRYINTPEKLKIAKIIIDQLQFCLEEYDFISDIVQENLPNGYCLDKMKLSSSLKEGKE